MCECDGCGGACCRFVVVRVGDMTADQRRWAEMRGTLTAAYTGCLAWRLEVPCPHLDAEGWCGIYDQRPGVCREFDVGGELCKAARKAREGERA